AARAWPVSQPRNSQTEDLHSRLPCPYAASQQSKAHCIAAMNTRSTSFGRAGEAAVVLGLSLWVTVAGCSTTSSPSSAASASANPAETKAMNVDWKHFGTTAGGTSVKIYTLSNRHGMVAKVTEYGAILTEVWVPDRDGHS